MQIKIARTIHCKETTEKTFQQITKRKLKSRLEKAKPLHFLQAKLARPN